MTKPDRYNDFIRAFNIIVSCVIMLTLDILTYLARHTINASRNVINIVVIPSKSN